MKLVISKNDNGYYTKITNEYIHENDPFEEYADKVEIDDTFLD